MTEQESPGTGEPMEGVEVPADGTEATISTDDDGEEVADAAEDEAGDDVKNDGVDEPVPDSATDEGNAPG